MSSNPHMGSIQLQRKGLTQRGIAEFVDHLTGCYDKKKVKDHVQVDIDLMYHD
jgi:hypothetical protein